MSNRFVDLIASAQLTLYVYTVRHQITYELAALDHRPLYFSNKATVKT